MKRDLEPALRAAAGLHWALLAAVYARLAAKAYLRFPLDWDFLAYHLPGALATWGLTSYVPEPRLVGVLDGFPPLPRVVAGALVVLTGRFSAASAINVLAFALLLVGLRFVYGRAFSLRWFLTALLGVPLFVFHFSSGYVDLMTGCWLTLAFAALAGLEHRSQRPLGHALLFVAALALAMLTKLQSWPVAGLLGAAGLWRFFWLARAGRLSRERALALGAALVMVLAAWPARNLVVHGNPLFPVRFPVLHALFPNSLMEPDSSTANLPGWLQDEPAPLRFAASVAEWNRLYPGERFVWTLDQAARANPYTSPHHRLGGWFPWTLAWLAFGSALAIRARLVPASALAAFAGAVALIAFLPQNNELRYWMFVPLVLAHWTALGVDRARPFARGALKAALFCGAAFVLAVTRPFGIDARPPHDFAPTRARAFWAEQAARPSASPVRICDVNPQGIFYSGPTFREYPVIACFSWEE